MEPSSSGLPLPRMRSPIGAVDYSDYSDEHLN
jgi:hypothetical protein